MTTTLADVRDELLDDPEVRAEYERLPSIGDADARLLGLPGGYSAQLARRGFRARQRAENRAPLVDKVAHRGGRVDAGPKAKPKAKGK